MKCASLSSRRKWALARWVCMASPVITKPVRSSGCSSGMNAVISLDLSAIWRWASTTPPWMRAATRCGALACAVRAPRTVLPVDGHGGHRGYVRAPAALARAGLTCCFPASRPSRPGLSVRAAAAGPRGQRELAPPHQPVPQRPVEGIAVHDGAQSADRLLVRTHVPAAVRVAAGAQGLECLLLGAGDPLPDRGERAAPGQD